MVWFYPIENSLIQFKEINRNFVDIVSNNECGSPPIITKIPSSHI